MNNIAERFDSLRFENGWTNDVNDLLEFHKPKTVRFSGDWMSEKIDPLVASSVVRIVSAAKVTHGFFSKFINLVTLEMLTRPKWKAEAAILPSLTRLETPWFAELQLFLRNAPVINKLVLTSCPEQGLASFERAESLSELFINRSQLTSLVGIEAFSNLVSFQICYSSKIADVTSLAGNKKLRLLKIENAKSLVDLSCVLDLPNLEHLGVVCVHPEIDITPVYECKSLQVLQIGGRRARVPDWRQVLSLRNIRKVLAPWDPRLISAETIRSELLSRGLRLIKFEETGRFEGRNGIYFELAPG